MFQTIYKEYVEEAFDKVEDTAKRMAAKKMLKLLGVKTFFPDPDEIPDITKAIEFFKSHLRNKKGKPIDAFDTMQKNDGRSGLSLFVFRTYGWHPTGLLCEYILCRHYDLNSAKQYNTWFKRPPFPYFQTEEYQTAK